MKRHVLSLFFLLLCTVSHAEPYYQVPQPVPPVPAPAPPPIPVPVQPRAFIDGATLIPSRGSIVLDGRRSTFDRGLQWKLLPPHNDDIFLPADYEDRKKVLLFMIQPPGGTYKFVLIAKSAVYDAKGNVVDIIADVDVKEVVVEPAIPAPTPPGPGPTPPGPTPPGPTPDPTPPAPIPPIAGALYVSYIHGTDLNANTAALVRSPTIKGALAAVNANWRVYQSDQDEITKLHFDKYFQAADVPCLLIQDSTGKIVIKVPSPDEAGVLAAVGRIRGGK